jgi:tagatose-1,6-bisphosphate aldolase
MFVILRDEFRSETDPAQRARLQKQFVEEEDRLGASAALLDDIEREIKKAVVLIARQTALVVAMERGGRDNVKQARTLLYCLIDDPESA